LTTFRQASDTTAPIPARAGVGLRPAHYADALSAPHEVAWVEVHPENYMCAGGPQHRNLTAIRSLCPLSFHGVGLSLGGVDRPDRSHLARLRALVDRYQPALFSEHLAWSSHGGRYLNDLLPIPYTMTSLNRLAAHVAEVQDFLGRPALVENPSLYVSYSASDLEETDFLRELVQSTGCGLLLDINNVHVSAVNCGYDPYRYVSNYPLQAVGEIHLAGHAVEFDSDGEQVLIDTHGARVASSVWDLYRHVIGRAGPLPTLIEWDTDLPDWMTLCGEAALADLVYTEGAARAAE
jgi:uncharacterized protein (UPF0276 family)